MHEVQSNQILDRKDQKHLLEVRDQVEVVKAPLQLVPKVEALQEAVKSTTQMVTAANPKVTTSRSNSPDGMSSRTSSSQDVAKPNTRKLCQECSRKENSNCTEN